MASSVNQLYGKYLMWIQFEPSVTALYQYPILAVSQSEILELKKNCVHESLTKKSY